MCNGSAHILALIHNSSSSTGASDTSCPGRDCLGNVNPSTNGVTTLRGIKVIGGCEDGAKLDTTGIITRTGKAAEKTITLAVEEMVTAYSLDMLNNMRKLIKNVLKDRYNTNLEKDFHLCFYLLFPKLF
jgi:hypothetical protein